MQSVTRSLVFIRKRKFLLMLPVLVIPFAVTLFYILGGGKGNASRFRGEKQAGLNLQLPDAHFFKRKEPDKLGLYEASNKDSDNRRQALRNDPYRADSMKEGNAVKGIFEKTAERFPGEDMADKNLSGTTRPSADDKAKELMEKLGKLKEQLGKPPSRDSSNGMKTERQAEYQEPKNSALLRNMNVGTEPDPEMNQLSKMLDKVLAIQHPENLTDSLKRQSLKYKAKVYAVNGAVNTDNISCLEAVKTTTIPADSSVTNVLLGAEKIVGFYGLDEMVTDDHAAISISAVIPETQTLVSGATVKLRLVSEIMVNGIRIPKDQFIYGTASLSNDRLKITINSIQYEGNLFPVSLTAYNLDGMEGLYVPGSISRDAGKQGADQAINGPGLETLDPSLGAQAAGAGIQMAKSLIGKKIKLVRVTVPAGYRMLLKDNNQK